KEGDEDAEDAHQRGRVQGADVEPVAAQGGVAAEVALATGRAVTWRGADGRAPGADRGVAPVVAEAGVEAGLAALDHLVHVQGVGGRLEGNPAVVRKVDLDPGVGVLAADHERVDGGVEGALAAPVDEAGLEAERAEPV